jgi:four helix bundle protein
VRPTDRFIAYQRANEASEILNDTMKSWRGERDLVDQIKRALTSVLANLSEGTSRPRDSADRAHYYRMACGSAVELEALLDSAAHRRLGPTSHVDRARSLLSEAARILTSILRTTRFP